MTTPEFYPPTKAILESRPELFVKVEAHVASDPESSDLLWLEYTPEDTLSEGEVICISPLGDSWYVSGGSAFKYGGWTTDWDTTGTADDVFLACSDIQRKGETMTSQESFKKWWNSLPLTHRITFQTDAFHWEGWQARQPEIDALKAEIQSANAELSLCTGLWHETGRMVETLKAENEDLRSLAIAYKNAARMLKAENEKLRKDAGRLDFLDTNKRFNMRWQVGIAPVGCISVRSIINGKLSIREAIDDAMTPDTKGE